MLYLNEIECEDNREFSDAEIERLAVSIGNVGLLNPLTLESLPDPVGCKAYRVIAGRRRYRALLLLQRYELADDEYRIVDPGDAELVSFVENVERKDLSLAEEVRQLTELRRRHDIGELASLLGRTRAYVGLRLKLSDLAGRWRDVLARPDEYPQWGVDRLVLIAREPAKLQRELEYCIPQALSAKEIFSRVNALHRQLSAAPFEVEKCSGCANRSDAQGDLFGDLRSDKGVCLDPACWSRRCVSACKAILAEHPELSPIRADGPAAGEAEERFAESLKLRASADPVEYRHPAPGEQPNALIVRGPGIGLKVVAALRKPGKPEASEAPSEAPGERCAAALEAEIELRRGRLALRKLADTFEHPDVWRLLLSRSGDELPQRLTRLALAVGLTPHPDDLAGLDSIPGDGPALTDRLCSAVCGRLVETLRWRANRPAVEFTAAVGAAVCATLGLEWEREYLLPAAREIPEPKELQIARAKEKTEKR